MDPFLTTGVGVAGGVLSTAIYEGVRSVVRLARGRSRRQQLEALFPTLTGDVALVPSSLEFNDEDGHGSFIPACDVSVATVLKNLLEEA
jgi:hypothetical protein